MKGAGVVLAAVAVATALPACRSNHHWSIHMELDGTRVHQAVCVWAGKRTDPAEPDREHRPLRFWRNFDGEGPKSPGSGMTVAQLRCPLGTVTTYRERFGGTTRPAESAARKLRAADRLADVVAGRLGSTLRAAATPDDTAAVAAAETFLRGEFRLDLRDLALTASWSGGRLDDACVQRLLEHGYLTASEAATGITAAHLLSIGDASPVFRRILRRALDLHPNAPLPPRFAAIDLSTAVFEQAAAAMPTLVAEMDAERAAEQAGTRPADAPGKPAKPNAYVETLVGQVLGLDRLFAADEFSVELLVATPVKPFDTNGTWHDAARVVRWSRVSVSPADDECFLALASWSEPDVEVQRTRFGRVVLDGERLALYAQWRSMLAEDDARRWDDAVAALRPEGDLARTLLHLLESGAANDPFERVRLLLRDALRDAPRAREGDAPSK